MSNQLTPLKAIRAKCLDCSNGSYSDVNKCPVVECTLHPYRFGKRPATVLRSTALKTKTV